MKNQLILLAWYQPQFVRDIFFPEIERNCRQYGILFPEAYEIFRQKKLTPDSLYFHHSYAESDIPIGQKYDKIALYESGRIQSDTIRTCPAEILCFFTAYRTQPSPNAMRGHHELSLIHFKKGIPPIIYDELEEVKEAKPLQMRNKYICLYSEAGREPQK